MAFHTCSTCRRHVKSTEDCPFCARARRSPLGVGVVLALAATTLVACAKDASPVSPDPATAGTTEVASPGVDTPAKPSQPDPVLVTTTTAATTASPTAPPTSVASAKPNPQPVWNKPQPTAPQPDRPMMARYGVAPDFR